MCSGGRPGLAAPRTAAPGGSTGRIDPGAVLSEGWQGGVGQFDIFEWGKLPYVPGETGGIRGHVANSTTRPFDDPGQLFQNLWEPLVPRVTVNLYNLNKEDEPKKSETYVCSYPTETNGGMELNDSGNSKALFAERFLQFVARQYPVRSKLEESPRD